MANVREVILPRDKRKDGTWNVKIRVTHQRKVKYISTALYVTEKHIRKDHTIKDPTILRALNPTVDDFRAKYKLPNKIANEKPKLTVKQVKTIWDCEVEPDSRTELARDLFKLSFCLCGMNAVDLYQLQVDDEIASRVNYNRSKTGSRRRDRAFISVNIPVIAIPLYTKYAGKLQQRYATHHSLDRALSIGMRKVGRLTRIANLEFYDARHAVGDWARNICRFRKDDVALALNHKDQSNTITDTYISKNWDIIDELQEAVINLIINLGGNENIISSQVIKTNQKPVKILGRK